MIKKMTRKPTNQQLASAIARAIREGGWTVKETQWAFLSGFLNALLWTGKITVEDGNSIGRIVGSILEWKRKKEEPS